MSGAEQSFSQKFGDKFQTKILGEKKKLDVMPKSVQKQQNSSFFKAPTRGFFPRTSAKNRTSKLMIHVRVTKKKDSIGILLAIH